MTAGSSADHCATQLSVRQRRLLLAGAALSMVGLAASLNPIAVCLTSVGRSFAVVSPARLGLIPTITFAGVVVGILLAGPLADRWGMRAFMILGALAELVGLVGMSLAPGYVGFLGATCLVGVGSGFVDALASPLVAGLARDNRTSALNFLHACYPIGAVIMIAGSSALLTHSGSWRIVFPVMSLPIAAGLSVFAITRFPRHEGAGQGLSAARRLARNTFFWMGMAGVFLAGATELGVAQWTPAYVENVFERPPRVGATVLLGFSLGMAMGRLGMGALTRRLAPTRIVLAAALGCPVCVLVAAAAPVHLAMTALVLTGLFVSCLWPTMLAYAADRVPRGGATLFSLLAASGNGGGMAAPAIVGLVAAGVDLRWGLATVAIYPLVAAVLFILPGATGRRSCGQKDEEYVSLAE